MKATYADVRAAYPASDVERHKIISPYSYYVLGVLSLRLTPLFINLGLRANTVTALGFVVALLIQPVIVLGALDPLYFVVASLLVHVFYLLDNIDGHIARFHRNSSYVGSLLDPLASWVQRTLFPVSLGLALYFSPSNSIYAFGLTVPAWAWIAVGITRMYAYLLTIAIGSKTDALLAKEALTVGSKGGRFTIVAKGIVELEPVFLIAAVPVGAVGLLHLLFALLYLAILGVIILMNLGRLDAADRRDRVKNPRT